ncbi:MAG: HAD family hydrolase, partial [Planctomycetota bacterium]
MTADNSDSNNMGVIFDLDGVLIDTAEFHRQSWFDLAEKEGFEITSQFFYDTFGMQNYQIIPILAKRHAKKSTGSPNGKSSATATSSMTNRYLPPEQRLCSPTSNVAAFSWPSAPPHRAEIWRNMDFVLQHIGVAGYFDAIVVGEDVKNGKPAPDTFLKAAEKLSLPPNRCVVVEDAVAGIDAAKSAGMSVIALTTTRPRTDLQHADLIVDSL